MPVGHGPPGESASSASPGRGRKIKIIIIIIHMIYIALFSVIKEA